MAGRRPDCHAGPAAIQIVHVLTGGDAQSVVSMQKVHQLDLGMQDMHDAQPGDAPRGSQRAVPARMFGLPKLTVCDRYLGDGGAADPATEDVMTTSASGIAPRTVEPGPAVHDFDFLHGRWRVRHRRLKERLVGSDAWERFDGTCHAWPLLDGAGNVDDNLLELPGGTY